MGTSKCRTCPACSTSNAKSYGHKNNFEILLCRRCGTIYTDRVPTAAEAEDYDAYYTDSNLSVPTFVFDIVKEIVAGFEPYRNTGRLLDIGSGAGTILKVGRDLGWEVYGLEVSKPAVEHARRMGFEVFHGEISNADYPPDFFDVVTASEVIEHLPDPTDSLRSIAKILRPGGLFWATTPSAESLSFRILRNEWSILAPPEHTQLYSRKGAKMILLDAGFTDAKFKTLGINPGEIINYFWRSNAESSEFNRMDSAYSLNEIMTRSKWRKAIKTLMNWGLNFSRQGDSLKILAIK